MAAAGLRVLDGTVLAASLPGYFFTSAPLANIWTVQTCFDRPQRLLNNQDHSMLAAMNAVDNIVSGRADKSNLWSVNAEQEYHESKG